MAAYVTPSVAHTYLLSHGIDHLPTDGAVELASDALDDAGPFRGMRYAGGSQARAFPRTQVVAGDAAGQTPDRIKRWVALESFRLDVNEEPPVTSISVAGAGSVTYATPQHSHASTLQRVLLAPYLTRRLGVINSAPVARG